MNVGNNCSLSVWQKASTLNVLTRTGDNVSRRGSIRSLNFLLKKMCFHDTVYTHDKFITIGIKVVRNAPVKHPSHFVAVNLYRLKILEI